MSAPKCDVCDGELIQYPGTHDPECSEFCLVATDEQKANWRSLKPGDFGFYPCAHCGCAIEDELCEDRVCSKCGPAAKAQRLQKALYEVLANTASGWINPTWRDVEKMTGLSEERCKEILKLATA